MKFFTSILALASAAFVYAQSPNPFTSTSNLQTSAGSTVNLTWTPTTPGTVSLLLRYGNSAFLNDSGTIASSIPNNGQYTWQVPSDIVRGSNYAIEIVSDSDKNAVNYTPQFIIDSPILTASSGASLIASATGSVSATASGSTTVTTSTTGSASGSASTSGSASASASGSGSTSGSATPTTSNTRTASSAGIQTTSGTGAAAPRATAMAGMLGFVALGAMAL